MMKIVSAVLVLFFCAEAALADQPVVFRGEIRGTINPATSDFLAAVIREAERAKAEAVIIELDTPGGLVSSVREMAQTIDQSMVPVTVFVSPAGSAATSAGALLMLASHVGAMAPGTNIGAAHPVGPQGEEIKGPMGEKVVNDTAAFARGLAELRGRPVDLAEAVVAKSRSFTADEALRARLIEILAQSNEELLQKLDQRLVKTRSGDRKIQTRGARVQAWEMNLGQRLLHALANPNIAAILMTLGILLIYVEVSNPGITVAGILGGICLLVAFMAFQALPIRTGGMALLILGTVLIIAEIFVTSHGALAAGGILSFVLGLIWLMDPSSSDLRIHPGIWIPIALVMGGVVTVITVAAARTRRLSRETLGRIGGGNLAGLAGYIGKVESVTGDGTRGKAHFRGEVWDVHSESPLSPGEEVEVVSVRGFALEVRPRKGSG